ncbi:MAG: FtsX-like permease family protein [Lachnospira sp.]|nr:FtsX-like permease family protein [Lachnospira sp.]
MKYLIMIFDKTIEMLSFRIRRYMFSILVCVVGVLLLIVALYLKESYWFHQKQTDDILVKGIEGTGLIASEKTAANNEEIFNSLFEKHPDMMETVGMIDEVEVMWLKKLQSIQNAKKGYINNNTYNGFECVRTSANMLKMLDIHLQEGELVTEDSKEFRQYAFMVYMGADYKDYVSVGDVYNVTPDGKYQAIVMGILEKGSKAPSTLDIMNNENFSDVSIDMDCRALIIGADMSIGYPMFFTWNDKYTYEQVRTAILEIAESKETSINVSKLGDYFKYKNEKNTQEIDLLNKLVVIVMCVVIVLTISIQIVAILKNKYRYGVLCVSGMDTRDIRNMIITENIIRFICTIIIAFVIVTGYQYLFLNSSDIEYMKNILEKYIYLKVILIALFSSVISTLIPYIIMGKTTVINLTNDV